MKRARHGRAALAALAATLGAAPGAGAAVPSEGPATAATVAAAAVSNSASAPRPALAAPAGTLDTRPAFTPDDLLLFEVLAQGATVTDALGAYSTRTGLYLPLGELARLLDLAIAVDPPMLGAEGWVLDEQRRFALDLAARTASVGGRGVAFGPGAAVLVDDEIYVRTDLLEKLLPLRVVADAAALTLTLATLERFPFEQRLVRDRARRGLGADGRAAAPARRVDAPYAAATAPAVDVDLTTGTVDGEAQRSFEVRVAGDLAYAGLQVYAGSDPSGELRDVRTTLERRDADGRLAGPFGATRASLGDVHTPALALGARSHGGRGFSITSEPLEQASVFDRVDLRGELPQGWDVELYVNEVLRAATAAAAQGRYEFADVPLVYGANVVRLAFYGPRGERREEVRRINVGTGQLADGQSVASLGVVQQGRAVFEPRPPYTDEPPLADPGYGSTQAALSVARGFAGGLTAGAALAQYAPTPDGPRAIAAASLAGSLGNVALRGDAARDDAGGAGALLAIAGRPGGASVVARHGEYRGGFVDEQQVATTDRGAALERSTDVRADLIAQGFGGTPTPFSLRLRRDERTDGRRLLTAGAQLSSVAGRVVLSNGLDYRRSVQPDAPADGRLTGTVDGSGALGPGWQLRAGSSYDVAPRFRLLDAGLTLDRDLSPRTALRVGVQHSFDDAASTYVQAGLTWRLAACDVSLTGGYATGTGYAQALLRFSMGALFDPLEGRYRLARPGAATGGALALQAFVDANGDGRRQADESPVPGVVADSSSGVATADADGRLLVAELGDATHARVGIRAESIEDPYLRLPADALEFQPRAGRVVLAELPLQPTGEVQVRLFLRDAAGGERGLSAVQVQLWRDGATVAAGRTEFDGTVVVDGLPPGRYELRIDPALEARLGLRLLEPVGVTIPARGGYAGDVIARVAIDRRT